MHIFVVMQKSVTMQITSSSKISGVVEDISRGLVLTINGVLDAFMAQAKN